MERVSENMLKRTFPRTAAVDPLLGLVEDRFRLLKHCPACDDLNDEEVFDRRLDEVRRRIRRLDERIVRTIATSTPGLLAQLRLLAAFYEESANGAGRRGSLLIQAIAEGVTQLEGKSPSGSRGRVQLRDGSARLPHSHVAPQSRIEVSASYRAAISAGRA